MTVPLPQDLLIHGALYLVLNFFSFLTFADDKANSKTNQWRTSEKRLLLYAMIGPFGAMAAMKFLRHKTQKIKFKLVYLFLAIHLGLIGYYLLSTLQVIRI
ncbi:hypothetical protein RJ53_07610 [Methanocalculus chunghsingensis]|uniref:DUF1294 domain-containing protein n=1 Tax=Methanocalculus chunghsingensis TaxID=156457 RepID=A0A8J7WAY4_9EURY|nr:DUF1294 domain-containing protein [Methanocalculus chunghsingensis]MBR1369367.1 hypothetical protein [Methanocalculus chunghsingensis]